MKNMSAVDWVFAVIFVALIVLLFSTLKREDGLFDACLADGHKEYECVGMLRSRR